MNRIEELAYSDKRKGDRLLLPLEVFFALPSDLRWIGPVELENISGGGFKFKSSIRIKKNSELNLKINLLDRLEPIILKGEAAWLKKHPKENYYSIGVKFGKMPYDDRRRYVSYICEGILKEHLNNSGKLKSK